MSDRKKFATVWLDGCSGCHMSFLDMDERLLDLVALVDIVYSPLVDPKEFPQDVDITLVEGAVSSEEDLHKIKKIRERTKMLISLGDCAVTANVPGMRNPIGVKGIMERVSKGFQPAYVPVLLPAALPVHNIVKVDVFIPGCPPSADTIFSILTDLVAGRQPDVNALTRFGA
jgi:NAD-reducing hydrogenase small subunit